MVDQLGTAGAEATQVGIIHELIVPGPSQRALTLIGKPRAAIKRLQQRGIILSFMFYESHFKSHVADRLEEGEIQVGGKLLCWVW